MSSLIHNPLVLGNRILTSLSELTTNLITLREHSDARLLLDRISHGVPIPQEEAARVLSLSGAQLGRLVRTSHAEGLPVPRWPVSRREWRWNPGGLFAWVELAGRLSAGETLADLEAREPTKLQALRDLCGSQPARGEE